MSSKTSPCQICGCTGLNLVDGFYYCVECGTQDTNVRETIVESTMLGDGVLAFVETKKITTVLQDSIQMSGEWHKWHAYNFILANLTDELIALGAKPTVKLKVLWIWVRYIKKFQKKDEPKATQFTFNNIDDEDTQKLSNDGANKENIDQCDMKEDKKEQEREEQFDINTITKGMLLSILYVALNLDKSHIQLGHLFQFIREGRLSVYNCSKFVPKELSAKLIPNWYNFNLCSNESTNRSIRAYAMTLFKRLQLGVPLVPDLNKIIDNFIQELCLPNDFKDLVLSLIDLLPCTFLEMDKISMKYYIYTPDYETECMSYILLALKLCFGLDCDYEVRLSDAVDKINTERDYLKSYKLGMYAEPTDRLFSFHEWYMFMQFRKIILSKYYLPMAQKYNLPVNDSVFMEHVKERKTRKIKLSDNVAMDIINKIHTDEVFVIPKEKFPVTFTPMTTYTEVISEYIIDPELKLRLCEDFSQYSLKYVINNLKFPTSISSECLIKGVSETNKTINTHIIGTLHSIVGDTPIFMVRNCENQNWLKTKPPKPKHVTNINDARSDNSYDFGSDYISDIESKSDNEECTKSDSDDENHDIIEEEDEELSIFHDDFKKLLIQEDDKNDVSNDCLETNEIDTSGFHSFNLYDSKMDVHDDSTQISSPEIVSLPENFDKEKAIQELINIASKKYKISLPKEKREPKQIRKRNSRKSFENCETGVSEPKKPKIRDRCCNYGESRKFTAELVNEYYENVNNDVLLKISEQVRSVIEMAENREEFNITSGSHTEIHAQDVENSRIGVIDDSLHINGNNDHIEGLSVDQNASVRDGSVQDVTEDDTNNDFEGENIEDLLPKTNPKFDPKTHNVNQLFVNVNDELDLHNIDDIDIDDSDLNKLIDEKIADFANHDGNVVQDTDNVMQDTDNDLQSENSSSSDDEDNVPLKYVKKQDEKVEYLVQNEEINEYKYWMRHYKAKAFAASNIMTVKFQNEVMLNCPKSFVSVFNECASIVDCPPYFLYRCLQKLEQRLMTCTRTTK